MMVESHRKNQRHHEKQGQNTFILGTKDQQAEETDQQDYKFRSDDVREDRAHKKAILTLEERQAFRAVMPDVKRVRDDLRLATCRTTQFQTATQYPLDLF